MDHDIILIRGLFRGQFHWGTFPEKIQALFPHRKVFCLDIPGAGEHCHQTSPTTIAGMVEALRAQRVKIDGTPCSSKVDIISISMGGMIGLKWAEQYPTEVSSVVCINTSAKGFSPFYQRLKPSCYLTLIKALMSAPITRESLVYSLVSNLPQDDNVISAWAEIEKRYPMQRENFFKQLGAATRFEITKPQCPLLFFSSTQDHLVNGHATRAIANQWQSDLIINESDGHDIPLDNPEWLCEHLSAWYSSVQ